MNSTPFDELRQKIRPPCPALDVHVHPVDGIGPHTVSSAAEDADFLLAAARRSGVERMCLFSLDRSMAYVPSAELCCRANDYALRLRERAPEVFLPFAYVTPAHPEKAVAEVRRCVAGEGMVGIKLWVARRATDPGLDPIMELAVELDVPVLQHAYRKTVGQLPGESYPEDVADLARRHPRARIIMAHLNGVNPRGLEEVVDCPNVVVDTSGGDPENGMVELAVQRLGAGRVVFGSDAPIRHFSISLAKILGTDLPPETQRAILWNNAARLLPAKAGVKLLEEAVDENN